MLGLQTGLMVGTFPYSVACAVVGLLPSAIYSQSLTVVRAKPNESKKSRNNIGNCCFGNTYLKHIENALCWLLLAHIVVVQGPMIRDNFDFRSMQEVIKPISREIPQSLMSQINFVKDNLLYYGDYVDAFDEGDDWSEGLKFFSLSQYWSVFNNPGACGREWLRFWPGYRDSLGRIEYDFHTDLFQSVFLTNRSAPWPLPKSEIVFDETDGYKSYERPGVIYPTFRWRRFWSDMIFKLDDDETIPETWSNSIKFVCKRYSEMRIDSKKKRPDAILVMYYSSCLESNLANAKSFYEAVNVKKIQDESMILSDVKELGVFDCR